MEKLDLDTAMRMIASKHHVDLSKINFSKVLSERDERQDKEAVKFKKMYDDVNRKRLLGSSVISDIDDLKQTFNDFNVNDSEQDKELSQAKNIAHRIIQGEKRNFTFSGNAGAGKTMLAISIINQIMKDSDVLTCYFASFAMLSQMNLDGIKDYGIKNDLIRAEKCIKNCDVLVLDDLGSETAFKKNPRFAEDNEASNYTQKLLFRIADYRKSKANIITTNNSSAEIQAIYNKKIYSRLIAKHKEDVIKFNSRDMRNLF